jgi:hypothetical protein
MGVAAAVACGLCGASALIDVLGGIGVLSSLGVLVVGFELASIVLAVLALGGAGVSWLRRRRRACRVPDQVADLGMPEPTRRAQP